MSRRKSNRCAMGMDAYVHLYTRAMTTQVICIDDAQP